MPPAEIWQAGVLINTVKGETRHTSKFDGREVVVIDTTNDPDLEDEIGCELCEDNMTIKTILHPGCSITLDHGEIVKAIK